MSCHFHDRKVLNYEPQQLYSIVADVAQYPQFLPGCLHAEILEEGEGFLRAELAIGYGPFKERYTSKVLLKPHARVDVVYERGPFKDLKNYWIFRSLGNQQTEVEFFIDFSFRSRLLQMAIESVFKESVTHLMDAFEGRAKRLF